MSDEQDPMVVILEPAVLGLAKLFEPRGHNIFPSDIRTKISRGVTRDWGTSKARRFDDRHGVGWIIDLSDHFNDEMLYAVIRSGPGGTRCVVAVVEAEEIEKHAKSKSPLPTMDGDELEAEALTAPASAVKAAAPRNGHAQPAPKPIVEAPDAPVLVIVMNPSFSDHTGIMAIATESNGAGPPVENIFRTTNAEVRTVVGQLLQDGIKPEQIEIWSSCRRPKVQIAFE